MSFRAQICSSPIADMTVTTRSFPSANPSLIYTKESKDKKFSLYRRKNKESIRDRVDSNDIRKLAWLMKTFSMTYLGKQTVISGKPQIILGVSILS
jgi:hypothetical protein